MLIMKLPNGETMIDEADLELFNTRKNWRLSDNGYVASHAYKDGKYAGIITLHRLLMRPAEGMVVDHINDVRHDNTRGNLRICTQSQNLQRKRVKSSSIYQGVSSFKRDGNFEAYLRVNGKKKRIGYFDTEIEAARAYNVAALENYGEFVRLNPV